MLPAAVPEPVYNCTVSQNATAPTMAEVVCQPGWNGGLTQVFHLAISRSLNGKSSAVQENKKSPIFIVQNLQPGTEYFLSLVSTNSQGSSPPTTVMHFTPIDIAKETLSAVAAASGDDTDGNTENSSSLKVVLLGVGGGIILSCLIVISVIIVRVYSCGQHIHSNSRKNSNSSNIDQKQTRLDSTLDKHRNHSPAHQGPDVILLGAGKVLFQYRYLCNQ